MAQLGPARLTIPPETWREGGKVPKMNNECFEILFFPNLILTIILPGRCFYPHFIDEGITAMSNFAAFSVAGILGPGMGHLWRIHKVPTPTLPSNKLTWAAGRSGRRHPYFVGAPRSALNLCLRPTLKELCSGATAQRTGTCELQGGHFHPRERNPFHTGTRRTPIYPIK